MTYKVESITESATGELIAVTTDKGKYIQARKAMLLAESGSLLGLRLETDPFSGKKKLAKVNEDIAVKVV